MIVWLQEVALYDPVTTIVITHTRNSEIFLNGLVFGRDKTEEQFLW